jgi:uncharacterized protein
MANFTKEFAGNKFFKNGHLETILPSVFRKISLPYQRQRLNLPDGDFLDLDFLKQGSDKLLLLFHGLEGSSHSSYIKGFARFGLNQGLDICAVNLRSCSGEPNKLLRSYHSGATEDVDAILSYLVSNYSYSQIFPIGFSLGGNLLLKYLGEGKFKIPSQLKQAAAFSVPIDLGASAVELGKVQNKLYMKRFLVSLNQKLIEKSQRFPEEINIKGLSKITRFEEWDDRFTAPLHGFSGAKEYYQKCSSKQFLGGISIPTLLVNAQNDPFLPASCYPENGSFGSNLLVEIPKFGGHCGFSYDFPNGNYYSEERAFHFFSNKE